LRWCRKTPTLALRAIRVTKSSPVPEDSEKMHLKAELAAALSSVDVSKARFAEFDKQVAALPDAKASLTARILDLSQKENSDAASLASVTQPRTVYSTS
jgi:hypothetical protein